MINTNLQCEKDSDISKHENKEKGKGKGSSILEDRNLEMRKSSLLTFSTYFYEDVDVLTHAQCVGAVNDYRTAGAGWGFQIAMEPRGTHKNVCIGKATCR